MPRSASNRFGAKLLYAYRTYRLPAFILYPKLYTITEKTNIKVFGKVCPGKLPITSIRVSHKCQLRSSLFSERELNIPSIVSFPLARAFMVSCF